MWRCARARSSIEKRSTISFRKPRLLLGTNSPPRKNNICRHTPRCSLPTYCCSECRILQPLLCLCLCATTTTEVLRFVHQVLHSMIDGGIQQYSSNMLETCGYHSSVRSAHCSTPSTLKLSTRAEELSPRGPSYRCCNAACFHVVGARMVICTEDGRGTVLERFQDR